MRVLFVDHEPNILRTIQRWFFLDDESWTIFAATDADQAAAILAENTVDAVVAETKMTCNDGTSLYVRIKELQPNCQCLILAGYISREQRVLFRLCEIPYVNKPCPLHQLKSKLVELVSGRDSVDGIEGENSKLKASSLLQPSGFAKQKAKSNLNPWHSGHSIHRKSGFVEEAK